MMNIKIKPATDHFASLGRKAGKGLKEKLSKGQLTMAGDEQMLHELKTVRMELEALRRKYADLYDFAPVGYFTCDKAGIIKEVNLTYAKVIGIYRRQLLNKPFLQFVQKDDRAIFHRHRTGIFRNPSRKTCEIRLIKRDGSTFLAKLESIGVESGDGGLTDCRIAVIDITEQKKAEEEILKQHKKLEQYAGDIESFTSAASQDLRAPLIVIEGFSRNLMEDYKDKLDKAGKHVLNRIVENTRKMKQLLDDIYAFSSITPRKAQMFKIDMVQLARAVTGELKPSIGRKGVRIKIKALPPAFGDKSMIHDVFSRLLSNSIKFTRPKDSSTIEIGGVRGKGENIYYVRDNYVGFDMRYAEDKLFHSFRRLHNEKDFGGNDIGLAIVKRIIEKHSGRVWAEGKVNRGAIVFFSLPAHGSDLNRD